MTRNIALRSGIKNLVHKNRNEKKFQCTFDKQVVVDDFKTVLFGFVLDS